MVRKRWNCFWFAVRNEGVTQNTRYFTCSNSSLVPYLKVWKCLHSQLSDWWDSGSNGTLPIWAGNCAVFLLLATSAICLKMSLLTGLLQAKLGC